MATRSPRTCGRVKADTSPVVVLAQQHRAGVGVEPFGPGEADDVGGDPLEAGGRDGHHVEVLEEVVHGEGACEAGRAERGQHVVRAGEVVADGGGAKGPQNTAPAWRTRSTRSSAPAHISSRCSGAMRLAHGDRLLGPVAQHDVAVAVHRGEDVGAAWRLLDQPVDRGLDVVGDRFRPGQQPREAARPVLGLHDQVDGGVVGRNRVVGDDDDLGRAGEAGRDGHEAPPGHLALGHAPRRRCRGRRSRRPARIWAVPNASAAIAWAPPTG